MRVTVPLTPLTLFKEMAVPIAVKEVSGVVPPIVPVKVTLPVSALAIKACAPSTVPFTRILPPDWVVSRVALFRRLKFALKVIPPVVAITLPSVFSAPALIKVTEPAVMALKLAVVNVPVKVPFKGPPLDAVIAPPRTKSLALRVIPATPFVLTSPLKVTVPPVSVILIELALRTCTLMFLQLFTVKAPIRVVPPMAELAVMSPVPAARVKAWLPLTVLEKTRLPLPAFKLRAPLKVMGPAKEMPAAVIAPSIFTAPAPVWLKAPVMVPELAAAVNVPLLLTTTGPALVVVIDPPSATFVPVRLIPPTALVLRFWKLEVPLPAVWVMVAAVI